MRRTKSGGAAFTALRRKAGYKLHRNDIGRPRGGWIVTNVVLVALLAACIGPASSVQAAETVTYTYDALGRVRAVRSTGGPNNNIQRSYRYDAAGNRTQFLIGDALALSRPSNVANVVSGGAVISVNVSGSGPPSGMVTFAENGVFLGSAYVFDGQASIFIQGLSIGVHTITVTYAGDDINEPYSRTFTIRVQDLRWLPAVLDLLLSN